MDKYPRLTFRLSQRLLAQINQLCISRHRTRGQIIREAVEMYYRVYNPVVNVDDVYQIGKNSHG
jgi:predicted DNA-binding protein